MNWHHDCYRWFVIGVFGRGELYNSNYKPNVFTRVRAHLDFIRRETGVASPTACKNTTVSTSTPSTTITTPTTTTTKPPTEMTEETTTTRPTSPTTTLPSSTTTNSVPFDCQGKPDGNYPNPASDCSITFFMCSNGDAYLFVSLFISLSKLLFPHFTIYFIFIDLRSSGNSLPARYLHLRLA